MGKQKVAEQTKEQEKSTTEKRKELSIGAALKRLRKSFYVAIDCHQREKNYDESRSVAVVNEFLSKSIATRAEHAALEKEVAALREKYGDKLIIKTRI